MSGSLTTLGNRSLKGVLLGRSAANGAIVGTPATTADAVLRSIIIPARTLDVEGRALRFLAWGAFAANGNNKRVRAIAGAATLLDTTAAALNGTGWLIEGFIIRGAAPTGAQGAAWGSRTGGVALPPAPVTMTESLDADLELRIVATNGTAAANDVTCRGFVVEVL